MSVLAGAGRDKARNETHSVVLVVAKTIWAQYKVTLLPCLRKRDSSDGVRACLPVHYCREQVAHLAPLALLEQVAALDGDLFEEAAPNLPAFLVVCVDLLLYGSIILAVLVILQDGRKASNYAITGLFGRRTLRSCKVELQLFGTTSANAARRRLSMTSTSRTRGRYIIRTLRCSPCTAGEAACWGELILRPALG